MKNKRQLLKESRVLKESEKLTATDVVKELYDRFPELEFFDERDLGDNKVKLIFEVPAGMSSDKRKEVGAFLTAGGVDYRFGYDRLRVVADEDEEYSFKKYSATSYYGSRPGIEDGIETDDLSELQGWCWEKLNAGNYVEVKERDRADELFFDPDVDLPQDDDYFSGKFEDAWNEFFSTGSFYSKNESLKESNDLDDLERKFHSLKTDVTVEAFDYTWFFSEKDAYGIASRIWDCLYDGDDVEVTNHRTNKTLTFSPDEIQDGFDMLKYHLDGVITFEDDIDESLKESAERTNDLDTGIKDETETIDLYDDFMKKDCFDETDKELIKGIRDDEKDHRRILRDMKAGKKNIKADESLKEEYGQYRDEIFMEEIANRADSGYYYGDVDGVDWEITFNGCSCEDFKSEELRDYMLVTVSYPIKDGHLGYYDLDCFIPKDFLSNADVREDLKNIFQLEDEDLVTDSDEFEFWCDFDVDFDVDEWEDAQYDDADESLKESANKDVYLVRQEEEEPGLGYWWNIRPQGYQWIDRYIAFDFDDAVKKYKEEHKVKGGIFKKDIKADESLKESTLNKGKRLNESDDLKDGQESFSVELKNSNYKSAEFIVDGLNISPEEVSYDNVELLIDGAEYDGHLSTWAGINLDASDIFEQVINAYLRNDTSVYDKFGSDWESFDVVKNSAEVKDGLDISLPYVDFGKVKHYELELATNDYRFYNDADEFLVLSANGGVVTDYENFYTTAFVDEIKDIDAGNTNCLYINEDTKEWLDSDEGKEWIGGTDDDDMGESLKEEWYHFQYTSGSNPYIATTEKERDRIIKKYGDRVKEIKKGFYEIEDDDEDDVDESLSEDCTGFDCFDNQFYTREDLNEIMSDVNDNLPAWVQITGIYADGMTLDLDIEVSEFGDDRVYIKTDMRKFKGGMNSGLERIKKQVEDEVLRKGKSDYSWADSDEGDRNIVDVISGLNNRQFDNLADHGAFVMAKEGLKENYTKKQESINIRESLNKIDLDTDNAYDLRNMYDSSILSNDQKIGIAKMISENKSPKELYGALKKLFEAK